MRGATDRARQTQRQASDFNPRSPCGERLPCASLIGTFNFRFQSTLPVRGATIYNKMPQQLRDISIHAPRAGSDYVHSGLHQAVAPFQSTLPVRGATSRPVAMPLSSAVFQSTLPVRGATIAKFVKNSETSTISIHAPRAGSDFKRDPLIEPEPPISIHAPRAGSDRGDGGTTRPHVCHFNPRSPCGERLSHGCAVDPFSKFQSTLPVRGATVKTRIIIRIFK